MSTAFGPDGGERDWAAARKKTSKLPFAVRALWDFERAHGRPATEGDVEAVAAALRETATRAGKDAAFVPEDVRAVAPSSMGMPAIDAVVGGILGQEILKAVSGKGAPCVNFFVFDAASGCGTTLNASASSRRARAPRCNNHSFVYIFSHSEPRSLDKGDRARERCEGVGIAHVASMLLLGDDGDARARETRRARRPSTARTRRRTRRRKRRRRARPRRRRNRHCLRSVVAP